MVKKHGAKDIASTDYIISNFAGPYVKLGLLICSLVGVLFPLYWLLLSAFKLESDHRSYPPVFIPREITFDHFIEVFTQNQLLENLTNSTIISIITTFITLLIGSMAAYAVQRGSLGKKTRTLFGLWFMVQKMYPAIATAIPVYLVMRSLRLIDTLTAMIIMNTSINKAKTLPVVIAGFITDRGLAWGPMAATSMVTLVPVVILTLLVQKDFVKGMAMGAVKG